MCRQKVNQHCSQLINVFLDIFFYSPNLLSPRSTVRVPNDDRSRMTLCMDRRASGGSARLRVRDKLPFPPRRFDTYLGLWIVV
ncbi:hypothetical protein QC761_0085520 [Podospora bellae-mahoneyi]|uniref:Uncharacterized protein n=1 Tax=Podospora bellae-mahoneyi TaxID=2093777 RepID=A0ABR0FHG9_9PEZI|nr:hypothetical protein QC761_0085520 [Podospora bellae-mahoneyi]